MAEDFTQALTQLLKTQQSLMYLQSIASSTNNNSIFPQLQSPLIQQTVQQQLINYSLQNLLVNSLSAGCFNGMGGETPSVDESMEDVVRTENKEIVVPSDDKEGWCRNKKYIEKTAAGFMCLVCKKVYGRYNSVSYHVTIYHRNPPIKCDVDGCDFTTREARYIHFHKFYRHGVALPRSIDQGSRRCSMCKHVSKSPAMLEKHMKRHVEGGWKGRGKRMTSICESEADMMDEGRCRTMSECTSVMEEGEEERKEEEEIVKGRSFTL